MSELDPKIELAQESIKKLRYKILEGSTTNRNKLINFKHNDRLRSQARIVDEIPDEIFKGIIKGNSYIFNPLPEEEHEPKDEKTPEFKTAYEIAQKEDEVYLREIEKLGDEYDASSKESIQIERDLKDRIRIQLKLGKRKTIEILGVEEYARKNGIDPNYDLPKTPDELSKKHKDKDIQTILKPDQLDKKLSGIKRLARTALNEKGINTLFLSFGFIEWFESENSDVKILSPLILLPVEIEEKKTKKGSQYIISGGDSDPQINIALKAKFERDFGIILKDLEEEEAPENYFSNLENEIKGKKRWSIKRYITLGHFQFARMAMYYDLDPDKWNNLGEQETLKDLFSGTGEGDGTPAEDYDVDDKSINLKVPVLLNQADASQFSAIVDVMNGKNLAIQGPPGTGKSQTIANIIGAALSNKKRILFLADKKAALDVVYKKLIDANLGDFCLKIESASKKKSEVIEDIKKRIELKKIKGKVENFNSLIQKEEVTKNRLIQYANLITKNIGNSEKNIYEINGIISKLKEFENDTFKFLFENKIDEFSEYFDKLDPSNLEILIENLLKLEEQTQSIIKSFKSISQHPWYGFTNNQINPYEKKKLVHNFKSLNNDLDELINISKEIEDQIPHIKSIQEIKSINDFKGLVSLGEIDDLDKTLYYLKYVKSENDINQINVLLNLIKENKDNLNFEKKVQSKLKIKKSEFKLIKEYKEAIKNSHFFSFLSSEYRNAKNFYSSVAKDGIFEKSKAINDLAEYQKYISLYDEIQEIKKKLKDDKTFKHILNEDYKFENTSTDLLENIIFYTSKIIKNFDKKTFNKILNDKNCLEILSKLSKKIKISLSQLEKKLENLVVHIDSKEFYSEDLIISSILKKNEIIDEVSLDEWIEFLNLKSSFNELENKIIKIFDENNLKYKNISETVRALYYNYLLKNAYDLHPELSEFNGDRLRLLRQEYKELDQQIFGLKKQNLFNSLLNVRPKQGISTGPTKRLTEKGLLDVITKQSRPRISLRQLIKKSSEALADLKPCFIMSPMTLAELVRSQEDLFDILIIDEASQMRMEDAIGAMARAKQSVIVGDPKQLAPTEFFDIVDESEDEEVNEESILDKAISRFQPHRLLRWHYRSRNEKLINFSNHHFYDNRLIIPPSPSLKKAIFSNKVDAIYKGKVNNQEIDKLLPDLVAFMKKNIKKDENDTKAQSCLIVTMNKDQAELIEDELRYLETNEPIISEYKNSWENSLEEFTIKNLESVQGDERDVIFISTLFGPREKGGKVNQTFGPINNQIKGHRRLNVLFSRAKREVHLYTSMHPNDILSEGAPLGRQIFKSYLEYAKTGKLEIGDIQHSKEPMSEFEIFVMNGLKNMGYEVDPQVGVSGFFIDIGVKHKTFPDGYILGVECDGKTYHSTKSARDRDILRQEVLEGMGWKIYRIWSTDWFKNPQAELKKLDKYIKKLIN